MPERVLLVACDPHIEERIKKKLVLEGSTVGSCAGLHDLPQALQNFMPTVVLVDDRKIGPLQARAAVEASGIAGTQVVALSDKKNEYGAVLGIGCLDAVVDWAFDGCMYILGCLGLMLLGFLVTLLVRWLS